MAKKDKAPAFLGKAPAVLDAKAYAKVHHKMIEPVHECWALMVANAAATQHLWLEEDVLGMKPQELGTETHLVTDMARDNGCDSIDLFYWMNMLKVCLEASGVAARLSLLLLTETFPFVGITHPLIDQVVCVVVPAWLHLMMHSAQQWAGPAQATTGKFAELLVVLLLMYCPSVLALFGVNAAIFLCVVWENIGHDKLGPMDALLKALGWDVSVEIKSSPVCKPDYVTLSANEQKEARRKGKDFLLVLVCNCMTIDHQDFSEPIRMVFIRDPIALADDSLLWLPVAEEGDYSTLFFSEGARDRAAAAAAEAQAAAEAAAAEE
ncbi:hypothetical protein OEZ85_000274 [Tetradesmus obliquus]|uniref:Uncharacterized protein n=1 Tax=Tetradesmus obliquus TaxID=3088 RepID=A0ABY8USB8_TETOB|nr:hypothetical protein OEZ85_000274 [Tetradesmus obliquus]